MRRSIVITKAATPAAVDNGAPELAGVSAALSAGSVGVSGAAWNLPATISVQQDGTVGLRQYALNAGAHTISVSGLPTGVTYNAGLEQLEGASTGTASATVTFTLTLGSTTVQATATVSLVAASGYTLANAIAGLPFAISTPTAPTIVDEATVTPATIAANMENGRRLILTAGDYGSLSFNGADIEIVLTTGVTISNLSLSGQRINVTASPVRSGRIGRFILSGQDNVLDGVFVQHASGEEVTNFVEYATRVAILSSYIEQRDYALYMHQSTADVIVANSHIVDVGTAQATVRSHSLSRYVFVDNRARNIGSAHHVFRVHGPGGTDICVRRNQFEVTAMYLRGDGGGDAAAAGTLGDVWFEDNEYYYSEGLYGFPIGMTADDHPAFLSLRNNNMYSPNTASWPPRYEPGWVMENNASTYYVGEPPAWEFQ